MFAHKKRKQARVAQIVGIVEFLGFAEDQGFALPGAIVHDTETLNFAPESSYRLGGAADVPKQIA